MGKQKKGTEQYEETQYSTNRQASLGATIGTTLLVALGNVIGTAGTENERLSEEGKSKIEQTMQNLKELFSGNEIKIEGNNDGNIIEKILHPGNVVIKKELAEKSETNTVTVHYDVAPHFEDSESIDAEKYEAIKDSIQSKLSKSIKETLIGFDFVKQQYEGKIDSTKYTLVLNSIEGHSSPEGYKFGDKSLKPGNYENENQNAANRRAKDAEPIAKKAFLDIISKDPKLSPQIDISSISISGEELQITEKEYDKLDSLRIELGYRDIVTMIKDNNNGKIADEEAVKIINEIINSKRNVIITYTVKGHPNDIFVIPLLFFPILIPKKEKIKKKIKGEKTWYPKPRDEKLPKQVSQAPEVQRKQPFDIQKMNHKKGIYYRRRDGRGTEYPRAKQKNSTGKRNGSRK